MLLSEISLNGFEWSNSHSREGDIASYTALQEFVSGFGFEIESWEAEPFLVVDVLPSGETAGRKFCDPKEMVKRGMAHLKSFEPKKLTKAVMATITKAQKAEIESWCHYYNAVYTGEKLKQQYKQVESQHINHTIEAQGYLGQMVCLTRAMEDTKAVNIVDPAALEALLSEGFYRFKDFREPQRQLNLTTREVFLSETKKDAKLDLRVNLGEFLVAINVMDLSIKILPWRKNLKVGTNEKTIHPHVGGSSALCWGEATPKMQKLSLAGDLVGLLRLLQIQLHHYNPGSTYAGLERFAKAQLAMHNKKLPPGSAHAAAATAPAPAHRTELEAMAQELHNRLARAVNEEVIRGITPLPEAQS